MKAEKVVKIIYGKRSIVYPPHIKEQAVREIESGQMSMREAMVKFEISKIKTIKSWIKAYGKDYLPRTKRFFPELQKRQIVIELESGKLTIAEILRKYQLNENTFYVWRKKYSSDIATNNIVGNMENKNNIPLTAQDKKEKQLIENLKLRIAALETMIDIAEKEYSIEIRKKYGSKQ